MQSEWLSTTWGEIATLEYGKALRGYQSVRATYRVYGTNGPVGWHTHPLCTTPGVVVGRKGAYRGIHYSRAPFFVIDTAFYLKPKVDLDSRWAYYQLLTADINSMDSGSAIPSTSRDEFYKLPVKVPPRDEQAAIADILEMLDDRIDLLRQTNATLESIAQALFKSWFVDFDPVRAKMEGREPEGMDAETAALFQDGFEESELGAIPRGWRVAEIGRCVDCVGGGTPSTKEPDYWEPAVHCWATPKDLSGLGASVLLDTERRLSDKGIAKVSSGLLPAGTLLMSSRAPIGYLALAQVPLAVNQGFIAMKPGGALPPQYLYFWCKSNMDAIKVKANGSTFQEISKAAFRPIRLVLPPQKIVQRFADFSAAIFDRIAVSELHRRQLVDLRDTLLPRLISGKLRLSEVREQIEEATA